MKTGYIVESHLWGSIIRGRYLHVFNYEWVNKIVMHERQEIDKDSNCLGIWKIKQLKSI